MEVKVPQLAEGTSAATVVNILVSPGDSVAKEQALLELEAEKAVAPLPSPAAGVVGEILVSQGDQVAVGQVVLRLAMDGEEKVEQRGVVEKGQSAARILPESSVSDKVLVPSVAAPGGSSVLSSPRALPEGVAAPASPSLRRTCAELGIDLTRVKGTGPGGRISTEDVRAYLEELQRGRLRALVSEDKPSQKVLPELPDFSKFGSVRRQALSNLRKTVAERMSLSWSAVPHVTQFDEADVSRVLELRRAYKEKYQKKGVRLTVTVLLLKAAADVLKTHPEFNASLDEAGQEVIYKDYVHIGLAVDTEQGLIVPVIREADKLSVLELSRRIEDLSFRARERKISLEELKGASFTVSNQGGIGGLHFTPIIDWPQTAVLGLGQSREQAVVREGQVRAAWMLPLSLSYDHRLIDGARAARFITDLVKEIEGFSEERLQQTD